MKILLTNTREKGEKKMKKKEGRNEMQENSFDSHDFNSFPINDSRCNAWLKIPNRILLPVKLFVRMLESKQLYNHY